MPIRSTRVAWRIGTAAAHQQGAPPTAGRKLMAFFAIVLFVVFALYEAGNRLFRTDGDDGKPAAVSSPAAPIQVEGVTVSRPWTAIEHRCKAQRCAFAASLRPPTALADDPAGKVWDEPVEFRWRLNDGRRARGATVEQRFRRGSGVQRITVTTVERSTGQAINVARTFCGENPMTHWWTCDPPSEAASSAGG